MSSVTFNTLAYARTLRDAGFSELQAEAITRAHKKAFAEMVDASQLAKADLRELEMKLERQLAAMKVELIKWMAAGFIMQSALLIAILSWLFPR